MYINETLVGNELYFIYLPTFTKQVLQWIQVMLHPPTHPPTYSPSHPPTPQTKLQKQSHVTNNQPTSKQNYKNKLISSNSKVSSGTWWGFFKSKVICETLIPIINKSFKRRIYPSPVRYIMNYLFGKVIL